MNESMDYDAQQQRSLKVLLACEFTGILDTWTEFLCLEANADGSITLSSRSREILGEVRNLVDDDDEIRLPETINGKAVSGAQGDYVIGETLVPHSDGSEITLSPGQDAEAAAWLADREWVDKPGYESAWERIKAALAPSNQ